MIMDKRLLIIIIVVIVGASVGGYLFYTKYRKKTIPEEVENNFT